MLAEQTFPACLLPPSCALQEVTSSCLGTSTAAINKNHSLPLCMQWYCFVDGTGTLIPPDIYEN